MEDQQGKPNDFTAASNLDRNSSGPQARAELLQLDAPERVVSFRSRGHVYRHTFRRITQKDWDGFFTRIEAETEQQGRTTHQMVNTDVASLWLYAAAIAGVEGYVVSDGRKLEELPNWQGRIPQQHRLLAVDLLTKVSVDRSEGLIIDPAGEAVTLDALWNEGSEGMKDYAGLKHFFETPTAEHSRKFLRARSCTLIVGGSKSAKTKVASAQPVLTRLYDELIVSVEGYAVADRAVTVREEIVREMDGFHKITAVGELFQTGLREEEQEEISAE
jgi:hypothetical protein